ARRRDVLAYPIAVGGTRPPVFGELAAVTGGRPFFVKEPRDLSPALSTITRELRTQYLLGYTPSRKPAGEPEWRTIGVSIDRPGVHVRARAGDRVGGPLGRQQREVDPFACDRIDQARRVADEKPAGTAHDQIGEVGGVERWDRP